MSNIKKIFKGCHYGYPFPFPKCLKQFETEKTRNDGNTIYCDEHIVQFDDSIIYELPDNDQMDVNKLFGFSYGLHHNNSDRIGFRYVPNKGVEIVLYSYCNGKRQSTIHIDYIEIGQKYEISLLVELQSNKRCVTSIVKKLANSGEEDNADINISTYFMSDNGESAKTKLRYSLGLYFGGNRRAPHTITIYDEQIKNKTQNK